MMSPVEQIELLQNLSKFKKENFNCHFHHPNSFSKYTAELYGNSDFNIVDAFANKYDNNGIQKIKNPQFEEKTVPLSVTPAPNGNYIIDALSICNLFGAHALRLNSIIFSNEDAEIESIKLIIDGKEENSICGDMYSALERMQFFPPTVRKNGKTIFSCLFFSSLRTLLLKSNTQIIFKLKENLKPDVKFDIINAKLILMMYKFSDILKSISNVSRCLNFKNNCTSYYIPQNNFKKVHRITLPFTGRLESIIILLQPFNKKSKLEFTGKIEDGANTMAILSPQINKINYVEYCWYCSKENEYNSNIVVVPFSVRTSETFFLDEGYYNLQSDNIVLEFELHNVTLNEDSGSVFVKICGIFVDEIVFPLDYLGFTKLDGEMPYPKPPHFKMLDTQMTQLY